MITKRVLVILIVAILAFLMNAGACVFAPLVGSVENEEARVVAALPLTETYELEENGTLSVSYPNSFEAFSEDGILELISPEGDAEISIYPLKRNLEGYTRETSAERFDVLTRDPLTWDPIAFDEALDETDEQTAAPVHKAYYRNCFPRWDDVYRTVAYCSYRGDYSVVGLVRYYFSEDAQRRYEETVDAVFTGAVGVPDGNFGDLLAKNGSFSQVPYAPQQYAQLTEDFDRRVYDRLLADMQTFTAESIPVEYEHTWIDYCVIAELVLLDHPELKPYYFDEFGEYIAASRILPDDTGEPLPESLTPDDSFLDSSSFRMDFHPIWVDEAGETADKEEMKRVFAEIQSESDAILAAMPAGLTVYGKYRYLAETVSAMIEYDMDVADLAYESPDFYRRHERAASVYGAFVDDLAICGGYADAYQYLCERAGLNCRSVGTDDHVLNLIDLYGGTYYVDPTNDVLPFEDGRFAFSQEELLAEDFYTDIRTGADDIADGAAY
jgi:hypothetical protein